MVAVAPGQSADETGSEYTGAAQQYSCSRTCIQYTIYDTRYTRYVWRIASNVFVLQRRTAVEVTGIVF